MALMRLFPTIGPTSNHRNIIHNFFYLVDQCEVNLWLLYRRDRNLFDVVQNRPKFLLAFRVSFADAFFKHNEDIFSKAKRLTI